MGGMNPAVQHSDIANSNWDRNSSSSPVEDVKAATKKILADTGMEPSAKFDVLVLTEDEKSRAIENNSSLQGDDQEGNLFSSFYGIPVEIVADRDALVKRLNELWRQGKNPGYCSMLALSHLYQYGF